MILKYIGTHKIYEVSNEIILVKNFMRKELCSEIIKECEKLSSWRSVDNDQYPGQEIRLNKLPELYKQFEDMYNDVIVYISEKYWKKLTLWGIRDCFIIKYTTETQTSLDLHHDHSLVTGSIKLSDSYVGGDLFFPRQNYSNRKTEIGDLLLWPGQVTHPHESLPLIEGVKHSFVLWTKRSTWDE